MTFDSAFRVGLVATYGLLAVTSLMALRGSTQPKVRAALWFITVESVAFAAGWLAVTMLVPSVSFELRWPVWWSRLAHFPNIGASLFLIWFLNGLEVEHAKKRIALLQLLVR